MLARSAQVRRTVSLSYSTSRSPSTQRVLPRARSRSSVVASSPATPSGR